MKKILSALFLFALTLSLSVVLCACNGGGEENTNDNKEETKVTYSVTVKDSDGNPVKGVKVEFSPASGTPVPFNTDADGKASFTNKNKVTAKVIKIPSGYEFADLNKVLSFDAEGKLDITLNVLPPFVIKVVDGDGAPVAGVTVQMCDESGSCRMPTATNEEGIATYRYEEGVFHASLTGGLDALPEGYTIDDPDAEYSFDNGVVIIVVEKEN